MVISTAIRSSAALSTLLACALSCSAHANLTKSYREMISGAPTLEQVRQYATNVPGSAEVISQSLYDFQIAPSSVGRTIYNFFTVPVGAGSSVFVTGPKTFADTNMENGGGKLPEGVAHLVTSLELVVFRTRVQNNPNKYAFGTFVPLLNSRYIEDFSGIFLNGFVSFIFGNANCFVEGLPRRVNARTMVLSEASLSSNSATAGMIQSTNMQSFDNDNCFVIDPPIFIPPKSAFTVTLQAQPPLPGTSTFPFTVGMILNGYRYRYSQ